MWRYLFVRLLQTIPTVIGIATVAFFLVNLIPGDPVQILAGSGGAPPEYYAMMRSRLGLDRPLLARYFNYVTELIKGNLGYSYMSQEPVLPLILSRLPATLLLGGTSLILALFFGITLGLMQAIASTTMLDRIGQFLAVWGYSIPLFWLGQLSLLVFSLYLGWFPLGGFSDARESHTGLSLLGDVATHLFLPAMTLATYNMAVVSRLTRVRVLEVLREDFVRTARAKGLKPIRVLIVHVLRNALLPVLNLTGMSFGFLVASSLVIETVFGWPGTGRLMFDALLARDYPVLLGTFVVLSAMVVIANILTDLGMVLLDPRIRL